MSEPQWMLSCDWGTSSFRLRAVNVESGRVETEVTSDRGAKPLRDGLGEAATAEDRARAFDQYLSGQLGALKARGGAWDLSAPVVISGMASSSVGWEELPYAGVPFPVDGSSARGRWLASVSGHRVLLISGLATEDDILRGEETQVVGLLASPARGGWEERCVVVLPGTHSKHVRVKGGSVVGFRTYLTGELFSVLCRHSILRFTTEGGGDELDREAFVEGVEAAGRDGLSSALFRVRTRGVLQGRARAANRSFLSGVLVGAECGELGAGGEDPGRVLLAAAGELRRRYELAASVLGLEGRLTVAGEGDLQDAVVAGHMKMLGRFI